jgi:hypothetical protein
MLSVTVYTLLGLVEILEGTGEGEESRWGLRDCLETNQADTTFKFMKCLFHVCPNPWLHHSSERITVLIAICMSAEGSEETGKGRGETKWHGNSCPILNIPHV